MNGKEKYLIQKIKKSKLLCITETKKKCVGEMIIEDHRILFSGVDMVRRAEAGGGMCAEPKLYEKIS